MPEERASRCWQRGPNMRFKINVRINKDGIVNNEGGIKPVVVQQVVIIRKQFTAFLEYGAHNGAFV